MRFGLIADTSCDLTPELNEKLQVEWVPFKLTVKDVPTFIDDENMKVEDLLVAMRASSEAVSTACPNPEEFAALMRGYDECFVITISSKLSGSYNAALVARDLVLEEHPNKKIHVLDSLAACAGETRIAMEVRRVEELGLSFEESAQKLDEFVANMHTVLVLENLSNLVKNGRLSKVSGAAAMVLGIRPLLKAEEGEILMEKKVRGTAAALSALVDRVAELTRRLPDKTVPVALAQCNCPERAQDVKKMLLTKCPAIAYVEVVPTKGLSSVYANEGGIVVAF